MDESKPTKGERTRQAILDVALRLFMEQGYEQTSMRRIAEEAGVSLGNAYYYFASKEHLVQGFYGLLHEAHVAKLEAVLTHEKSLKVRLRRMLETKIESAAPYHAFAAVIFRTAADPKSPLNPFGAETMEVRRAATLVVRRVVEGSKEGAPKGLEDELPELLWLYEMAVVLFWIHDQSPGFARTYRLIESTVDIVARLLAVIALPLLGPIRRATKRLLAEIRV
jgi:AcrR family transcriptional regulator